MQVGNLLTWSWKIKLFHVDGVQLGNFINMKFYSSSLRSSEPQRWGCLNLDTYFVTQDEMKKKTKSTNVKKL